MKLALPKSVQYIIESLTAHGFEAFAVGGCVRDALLGREPDDWDITTSARPEQMKQIFRRTVDTGIAHGTVTVLYGGEGYEVTTYRIDGEYEDNRHPKEVSFTASLKEDLRRRDFTINAMAYNEESGLVDAFGGVEDLEAGRICCVGMAEERFGEDALRILRGARFAAQLGFSLEEKTKEAMKKLAPNLADISAERIQVELSKLLLSKNPEQIEDLIDYGIASVIFPEYEQLAAEKRQRLLSQLKGLEERKRGLEQLSLRWAAVLQFFGEDGAGQILRRFKYDNQTIRNVKGILKYWAMPGEDRIEIRKALSVMGEPLFNMVMEFNMSRTKKEEELAAFLHMLEIEQDILDKGECVSLKELAVTGSDLLAAGCPKGRQVGSVLQELLELVLECPEANEKERLLEIAKERIGEMNS